MATLGRQPGLAAWIAALGTVAAATLTEGTCDALAYQPLDVDLFERAALLPDPVLAELILNADASFGAARDACTQGDPVRVAEELHAARATVALLESRMTELENQ